MSKNEIRYKIADVQRKIYSLRKSKFDGSMYNNKPRDQIYKYKLLEMYLNYLKHKLKVTYEYDV